MKMKLPPFQFRLQNLLESEGFVVLPVRSSDLPVDLIALKHGKAIAYRCKFHGHVYEPEMQKLRAFAEQAGIEVYIAKVNGQNEIYFQKPKRRTLKRLSFGNPPSPSHLGVMRLKEVM